MNYLIIIYLNYYILLFICRAIDFQALVGNIGGYIGLLLGYSLLQIPDLITWIVFKSKRCFNRSSKNKHDIDQLTKGSDIKHHALYHDHCKEKITYVAHPTNSSNALSGREIELLKRIENLEEWRAEMIKI